MVRISKWHEKKILFTSDGHAHTGGSDGAHIQAGGLATGCIVQYPTTGAKLSLAYGATSIDAAATVSTGLTSVTYAWTQTNATAAATAILVATSGGDIRITPGAAGQTIWWFAWGYV